VVAEEEMPESQNVRRVARTLTDADATADAAETLRPSQHYAPQGAVVRNASAFIWAVLVAAGSPSMREAAMMLHGSAPPATRRGDPLRHMLFVAVAVLCDQASRGSSGEAAASPAADGLCCAELVRSAQRLIASVEQASSQDLAGAHAYFLAPPWRHAFVEQWPWLADLSFGVARFMIECAWECRAAPAPSPTERET
jgi:hypothetical protein